MEAPGEKKDANGTRPRRAGGGRGPRCAVCGGELSVLVEVPTRGLPHEQDYPSTRYFRCNQCAQIQIVDN